MPNIERKIILICHNLRSCHNVGSLLRTCEGLGVYRVYLTGYSPYPVESNDTRLPHLALKSHKQIQKTALGAESMIEWRHAPDIYPLITDLKNDGYTVAALEQTSISISLPGWKAPNQLAIIIGRETEGIEKSVIDASDICLEIPMLGRKESYNVVQAAAMALYHARFSDTER